MTDYWAPVPACPCCSLADAVGRLMTECPGLVVLGGPFPHRALQMGLSEHQSIRIPRYYQIQGMLPLGPCSKGYAYTRIIGSEDNSGLVAFMFSRSEPPEILH